MLSEITPEQMDGHIAAMRAEPWGEQRADHRTAFIVYWMFKLWGSVEEGHKEPEADDFLGGLLKFIEGRSIEDKTVVLSPEEAAARSKGMF